MATGSDPRPEIDQVASAETIASDDRASVSSASYDDAIAETVAGDQVNAETMASLERDLCRSGGLAAPMAHPGAGDVIDRFSVLGKLGEGGMGVVLAAYDPDLDRKVAIKLLRPDRAGEVGCEQSRTRLLREAQAMARLSHPNVVVVHEVGTFGDAVFVAMEHVTGATLKQWCERKPRTWRQIVDLYLRAGEGLAAAHEAGLVHRDFKPENVLVGEDGRVRVTDFGLVGMSGAPVRAADADAAEGASRAGSLSSSAPLTASLTRTGALMGTPIYMAPEQHRGEVLDARADQFAFCVALYEALYGERPFDCDDYDVLAQSVCEGTVREAPSEAEVPAWLRRILLRGLRPSSEERYPDMSALLAELARDPASSRKRRLAIVGVAAISAAVAGFAVFALGGRGGADARLCQGARDEVDTLWNEATKARIRTAFLATDRVHAPATYERVAAHLDSYTDNWVTMRTDACEATHSRGTQSQALLDLRMRCLDRRLGALGALIAVFADETDGTLVDHAFVAAGRLPALSRCADAEALSAAVPLPDDPDERLRLDRLRAKLDEADALSKAGKYQRGLPLAVKVLEEARLLDYAPLLGDAAYVVGTLQIATGEFKEAEATFEETTSAATAARDDALFAHAWIDLVSTVGYHLGRSEEALAIGRLAESAVERVGDELLEARFRQMRGIILEQLGRGEEALEQFRAALKLAEANAARSPLAVQKYVNSLGSALLRLGRLAEAAEQLERAVAMAEEQLGADHPTVGIALHNTCGVLVQLERYAEADKCLARTLDLRERGLGSDHPDVAYTLDIYATSLTHQGRYDEALVLYQRSLAILEKSLGPEHADVAIPLTNLGVMQLRRRDYASARAYLERARQVFEKALGPDNPLLSYPLTGLGQVAVEQGRAREALAPLELALRMRVAASFDPVEVAETRFALARALWDAGRGRARARELGKLARSGFAAAGARAAKELGEVDAWLADT